MKSIILLAMSTLNANVFSEKPGDTFSVAGNVKKIENCKSQLEPVVRYFLDDIQSADEVDILMLCTRQTLEIATNNEGEKFKDAKGNDIDDVSAVTFLMSQIDKCKEKSRKKITYKAFPLYREGKERTLPQIDCNAVLANTDEKIGLEKSSSLEYAIAYEKAYPPDYLSGMRDAIQSIRNTVKENIQIDKDFQTPFYIVTHGGPRDVMLSLNAVVSLLDEEGIIPTKICGTNLATKMIDDQRASFDMFRFVSGMRDFLNFGNVDVLKKYYSDSTTFLHGAVVEEENIVFQNDFLKAMDQVSIGVQYSNPDSYREGLNELNKIMTDKSDIYFSNSNLGIFKDTIINDFGSVFKDNEINIIDMVERCVNKKQYQQALTFLESNIPEYYRDKSIVIFSDIAEDKYLQKFKDYLGQLRFSGDNIEQVVCNYIKFYSDKIKEISGDNEITLWDLNPQKMYWYQDLDKYVKNNTLTNIYENRNRANISVDFQCSNGLENTFVERVLPLLMMHKALKGIRNIFNHGNGQIRPSFEDLELCMRYYLKDLKKLGIEQSKNR